MEEIGELIRKGFGIWKSNLNLSIPFLYSIVASALLAVLFTIISIIFHLPFMVDSPFHSRAEHLLSVYLLLATIIIGLLIRLFFNIGAIGVARQVLEEGRSDTSSMWSTGKRHFWNMFLLSLIMWLTILAVFILISGIEQLAGAVPDISDSFDRMGMLLWVLIISAPVSTFALILSVVLSPAPYALVLEGLGPVQAIRAGVDFFRGNKFDVLVLYLVTTALSLLILLIIWQIISLQSEDALSNILQSLSSIILLAAILADLLILAPLTNLWWTRFYMVRKGKINEE